MTDTALSTVSLWRYRMPFSIRLRGGDLTVRLGFTYPWPTWMQFGVGFRLHYRWDKDELPGLHAWAELARLHLYLHIGAGWLDENGESRTLLSLGAYLKTYGLRYVGCWRGHQPERTEYNDVYFVHCKRCRTDLEHGPVDAAA